VAIFIGTPIGGNVLVGYCWPCGQC